MNSEGQVMLWPPQALLLGLRIVNQGPPGDGQGGRKTSVYPQEGGGACSRCTSGAVEVGINGEGGH